MALTTNIIGYWKMDGNSNDSVGSSNGTDTSITYSTANGVINNGAGFNGTSSKITIADTADLRLTGDEYTVSFWCKTGASVAGVQRCINKDDANDYSGGYGFWLNAAKLYWAHNSGSSNTIWTNVTLAASTTYFLTFVFEKGAQRKTYVNGSLINSSTTYNNNITGEANDALIFGAVAVHGQYWTGALDEISFWSRALTATEVSELYNSGDGLQYPFSTTEETANNALVLGTPI